MKTKSKIALGVALALCGLSTAVQGETLEDFLMQSKVEGQIRSYYFNRLYGSPQAINQNAYALGGILNIKTAELAGFSAGASFYAANSLGTHGGNLNRFAAVLMGPKPSLNALGQAYLQYQYNDLFKIKVGDQIINTPWMNASDSYILPATYQAVLADITPVKWAKIIALREFRWKSRTSGDYYKDNLYYPSTYDGDFLGPGQPSLPASSRQSQGTLAFGVDLHKYGAHLGLWYYDFYRFTKMCYGDVSYKYNTNLGFTPFVDGQFLREWQTNSLLNGSNPGVTSVDDSPYVGQGVNATAYGVRVGLSYAALSRLIGKGSLSWGYNGILVHAGAIGGGAIISPYTVGYTTDPLYSSAMIRGLVESGPGNGWRAIWTQWFANDQVRFIGAFAEYHTYFNGASWYPYADLTYFFQGPLKGLSIRDRVEVANGLYSYKGFVGNGNGLNKGHSFVYNRVMLTYAF